MDNEIIEDVKPVIDNFNQQQPSSMETGDELNTLQEQGSTSQVHFTDTAHGDDDRESILNQIARMENEKANAERSFHNIAIELNEQKIKTASLVEKNSWLEERLAVQNRESLDRQQLYQKLEDSRNEIADRILKLETELNKTKSEKDERDSKINSLTREKQLIMTENVGLQEQLRSLTAEKSRVSLQLQGLQTEARNVALEKEWRRMDSQMYEESKKWFMKEVSERDAKLTQITLEIRAKEIKWKSEELTLTQNLKKAEAGIIALDDKLKLKEETLARVTANIEQQAEKNRLEFKNLEADLKVKEELAEHYRRGYEESEKMAEELAEQLQARNDLIAQSKEVLEEARIERDEERKELQRQLDIKETELCELRDEIEKLNEQMKSKHAVSLNITEEELAKLSPAAAETTRFMKGSSNSNLTSLVRDHARLAGELASEKEKSRQLEDALQEIVRDLEENMPQFVGQKDQLNQVFDENSRLKSQLKEVEDYRLNVEANRDQALRELAFTKTELEKYQQECVRSSQKIERLLFVIDQTDRGIDMEPLSTEEQKRIYDNLHQLNKLNIYLEAELAAVKASAVNRHTAAQSNELAILRQELTTSKEVERQLNEQLDQINVAFESIREQNQKLMDLHRDDTTSEQLRDLKLKYYELTSELDASKMKIVRLEATISGLQQEKSSLLQIHEARLNNSMKLVDELKSVNAKLEAKFEYQNQIAETNAKEMDLIQKEIHRVEKENIELKNNDNENAHKIARLHEQILQMNEQNGELRTECRRTASDLERLVSENAQYQAQLEVFRNRIETDQYLHNSIMDLNSRLQIVQADKEARRETQAEVLQIERDNLKRDLTKLNEQLIHSREETKNIQARLDNEVSLLAQQLVEKDERIRIAETSLYEHKLKLEMLQSATADVQTDEMSPERLRKECQQLNNRLKFLEAQLEDSKVQLETARAEVERNQSEALRMESHSGKMESGLKDVQEIANLVKERLVARAEAAEKRGVELAEQIVELRNLIDEKSTEYEQLKLSAVETEGDLKIRVEVQQQQIQEANTRIAQLNERISQMMKEYNDGQHAVENMKQELLEAESRADEAISRVEILNSKISTLQNECIVAENNVQLANDSKLAAQQALEIRNHQADQAEAVWRSSVSDLDERLKKLIASYDQLVEKIGSASDDSLMNIGGEGIVDTEKPQAALEAQRTLIDFLRQEKDNAVMRSLNAEVEVRRVKADLKESLDIRSQLLGSIRKLEVAAATADQVTAEKAELLKKLEHLGVTQQQFQRARQDKENLQKLLTDMQKNVKSVEEINNTIKSELEQAKLKSTALNAEIEKKNKEIETLKVTLQRQARQPQNMAAGVQNQKLQTELAQKQGELDKTLQQVSILEASAEQWKSKFEQARNIAKKYRDEINAKKPPGAAGSTSSATAGDVDIEKLKREIELKTNEYMEASFRLNLLTSKVQKMEEEKKEWLGSSSEYIRRIQDLERMLQARIPQLAVSTPVTSSLQPILSSNKTIDSSNLMASDSVVEEPDVSATIETVSPPDAGLNVGVESANDDAVRTNAASSTAISPGHTVFDRPTASNFISSKNSVETPVLSTPSVSQQLVSGSIPERETSEDVQNDSESRDSNINMPVSTTGGNRKRTAGQPSQIEPKRQRETSNEAVSSSEERMEVASQNRGDDDVGLIPDPIHADHQNDDDDDIIPVDPPNQDNFYDDDEEIVEEDEEDTGDEDVINQEFEVPDSDEGASEMDNADSSDSGDDEDIHPPIDGGMVASDNEDEDGNSRNDADQDQDVEVIGVDDNSRSQPILDYQDREAASAVEEADDEGRNSADGGIPNQPKNMQTAASSVPRARIPITFDTREDQCSSSNESGPSSQPLARQTARRARPTRGVYQATRGRGVRGSKR